MVGTIFTALDDKPLTTSNALASVVQVSRLAWQRCILLLHHEPRHPLVHHLERYESLRHLGAFYRLRCPRCTGWSPWVAAQYG